MKLFTKLSTLAISAFLLLGVGLTIGQQNVETKAATETLACPAGTVSNNALSFSTTNFNIVHAKGTGTNFGSYSPWRFYANNTITITPKSSVTEFSKIEFVHNGSNYGALSTSLGSLTQASTLGGTSTINLNSWTSGTSIIINTTSQARFSSITFTFVGAQSDVVTLLSVSPNTQSLNVGDTISAPTSVTATKNGVVGQTYTNYSAQVGTLSDGTFTSRKDVVWNSTTVVAEDNCVRLKALDSTTSGGSTYVTADITLTVTEPVLTKIVLSQSYGDLIYNEKIQLSYSLVPSNVSSSVSWSSSNTDVATVSDAGLVTASASTSGEAIITATSTGNSLIKDTCKIFVAESVSAVYKLADNINDLAAGDKVIIAASGYDYAVSTVQNSNNRGTASISKNSTDDTITFTNDANVCELTLGISSEKWTLFDSSYSTNGGYLYAGSSSSNYLKTQATNNLNGQWTISIANKVATITAQGSNTNNLFQYNSSSSLFSCYGSSQKSISIYYRVSASTLSHYVMASDADNQCSTKFVISKAKYLNLSSTEQDIFKTSHAGEDSVLTNARKRYEAWATNKGQNPWETDVSLGNLDINKESNIQIIAIATIGVISLASVGAFLFHNKKRIIEK